MKKITFVLLMIIVCGSLYSQLIPDENFKRVINVALNQSEDYEPTVDDLSLISQIDGDHAGISSIEGAQYLVNACEIYLNNNNITDVSQLAGLQILMLELRNNQINDASEIPITSTYPVTLRLDNNEISDISFISNDVSPGLILSLSNNNITDISGLANIEVADINLSWNNITDVSVLEDVDNITSIDLSHNNITSVGSLNRIESINLSNNMIDDISSIASSFDISHLDLSYNLLSDISNLYNISVYEGLNLSYNNITDIPEIPFAPIIDLSNNNITDISSLTNSSSIRWLNLSNNQINEIPEFSNFNSIEYLDLNDNNLYEIEGIQSLSNLREVYLSNNMISNVTSIGGSIVIEKIDLSSNNILESIAFQDLPNLCYLDISNNSITDLMPIIKNQVFGYDDNFLCSNNPLSTESVSIQIPILEQKHFHEFEYTTIPNLDVACYPEPNRNEIAVDENCYLSWHGNFASSDITYEIWLGDDPELLEYVGSGITENGSLIPFNIQLDENTDYWWKIKTIVDSDSLWSGLFNFSTKDSYIHDGNFRILVNRQLNFPDDHVPNIEELESVTYLSNRNFHYSIYSLEGLQYMTNLHTLIIENSDVEYVPPLIGFEYINHISLVNNKISNALTFEDLPSLSYLHLSRNEISEIPTLINLNDLEILNLSYNQVQVVTKLDTDNPNCDNVKQLFLNDNLIIELPDFNNYLSLTTLDVKSNPIDNIASISNLENLRELDISHTNIGGLQGLAELTDLVALVARGLDLVDISHLINFSGIIELDLSSNNIQDITALTNLNALRRLKLSHNFISDFSPIYDLQEIRTLYIGNNNIEDISFINNYSHLVDFRASNNKISDLSFLSESQLTPFNTISLKNNLVTDIFPLVNLRRFGDYYDHLFLQNNPLSLEAINTHMAMLREKSFYALMFDEIPNYNIACYPIPERNEINVSISANLEWEGNFDDCNVVYEVFLGESKNELLSIGIAEVEDHELVPFSVELDINKAYWWRVDAITEIDTLKGGIWKFFTGDPSVDNEEELTINDYELLENYPNPFNPSTTISFSIPVDSEVELSIFNVKGQKIKTLANGSFKYGMHKFLWNGKNANEEKVSSGLYLYRLNIDGKAESVRKCLLLK
jgi:Leucine-rich repeat (LRR) protein